MPDQEIPPRLVKLTDKLNWWHSWRGTTAIGATGAVLMTASIVALVNFPLAGLVLTILSCLCLLAMPLRPGYLMRASRQASRDYFTPNASIANLLKQPPPQP